MEATVLTFIGCFGLDEKKKSTYIGGFPKMVCFPNNHGVFLLKMSSTWGNIGGTTILKNNHHSKGTRAIPHS